MGGGFAQLEPACLICVTHVASDASVLPRTPSGGILHCLMYTGQDASSDGWRIPILALNSSYHIKSYVQVVQIVFTPFSCPMPHVLVRACTKVEWWTELNRVAFDMWSVYITLSVSRQLYISTTVRSIGSLFHFCRSKCDKLSITSAAGIMRLNMLHFALLIEKRAVSKISFFSQLTSHNWTVPSPWPTITLSLWPPWP